MNKTIEEIKEFFNIFRFHEDNKKTKNKVKTIIFPTFLHILQTMELANNFDINVGAQNCCFDEFGAYTGEISAKMLAEISINYVILGHSERKQIFFESDEMINKKLKSVLKFNISPILCIGETSSDRKIGSKMEAVSIQLKSNLNGIDKKFFKKIIIAYEPLWAIGSKKPATSAQINEMCKFIRYIINSHFNFADEICILYGGSVTSENTAEILLQPEINGILVGKASLDPDEFFKILKSVTHGDETAGQESYLIPAPKGKPGVIISRFHKLRRPGERPEGP
jgi:triosephosphate isomerase